ncbi:class I SAM-dependent methyltransferase [Marimonas sp. MJW-29]|uniref:Class I SAM-dependent methyltransferase n=1 Tax=Sulfitobacter sediminis TaxID=3234186 RepID=A0ABV3RIS3_9RHOB
MTNAGEFWDNAAGKYAASPIKDPESYEYTLGRTRSYLQPTDRVLEIGAGTGSTALQLAADVAEITGTDISREMMRIASDKALAQKARNVTFQVKTAQGAAEKAGQFDVVLGFNILHLTNDMERVLSTLYREMAPGSMLITKTPCIGDPSMGLKRFAIRAMVPVMQLLGKAPFVRYLTVQELEAAMQWAGFRIIETCSKPAMSRYIVARRP